MDSVQFTIFANDDRASTRRSLFFTYLSNAAKGNEECYKYARRGHRERASKEIATKIQRDDIFCEMPFNLSEESTEPFRHNIEMALKYMIEHAGLSKMDQNKNTWAEVRLDAFPWLIIDRYWDFKIYA